MIARLTHGRRERESGGERGHERVVQGVDYVQGGMAVGRCAGAERAGQLGAGERGELQEARVEL